jgi:hypothetical protein
MSHGQCKSQGSRGDRLGFRLGSSVGRGAASHTSGSRSHDCYYYYYYDNGIIGRNGVLVLEKLVQSPSKNRDCLELCVHESTQLRVPGLYGLLMLGVWVGTYWKNLI